MVQRQDIKRWYNKEGIIVCVLINCLNTIVCVRKIALVQVDLLVKVFLCTGVSERRLAAECGCCSVVFLNHIIVRKSATVIIARDRPSKRNGSSQFVIV